MVESRSRKSEDGLMGSSHKDSIELCEIWIGGTSFQDSPLCRTPWVLGTLLRTPYGLRKCTANRNWPYFIGAACDILIKRIIDEQNLQRLDRAQVVFLSDVSRSPYCCTTAVVPTPCQGRSQEQRKPAKFG